MSFRFKFNILLKSRKLLHKLLFVAPLATLRTFCKLLVTVTKHLFKANAYSLRSTTMVLVS